MFILYICMYVCMYICITNPRMRPLCQYVHICVYACMHVCMYACMNVCMYARTDVLFKPCIYQGSICVRVCLYRCAVKQILLCVFSLSACVCVCVWMYAFMHAHTHVCMHACVCLSTHACICMFVSIHETATSGATATYVNIRRLRGMHSTDATGPVCLLALACSCAARSASRASLILRQNCNMAGPSSDRIPTNGLYSGPSCLCVQTCLVCTCVCVCRHVLFVYVGTCSYAWRWSSCGLCAWVHW